MTKGRLESFSDGVFAFAITLLVLGIQIPNLVQADNQHLRSGLLHAMQGLVPYIASFATIGIIWLNHHSLFHGVERVDHTVLLLNLLLLLVVSFIPFPTAVLGRYGALPSGAFLYGCALTALGGTYTLLSFYIVSKKLCRREVIERAHEERLRNMLGTVAYPVATLLALRYPRIAIAIYVLLAAFYLVPGRGLKSGPGTQVNVIQAHW